MPLIVGTPEGDTLTGGDGADTLDGGAGSDVLRDTAGGDDSVLGGPGNDQITVQHATSSRLVIHGGDGNDFIVVGGFAPGGRVAATVTGGDGVDLVSLAGPELNAVVDLGSGDDGLELRLAHAGVTATLGGGSDRIGMGLSGEGAPGLLTVTDFQPGDGGDRVELTDLRFWLANYDESNPFGSGHLQLVQVGSDTLLRVDRDGGGDDYSDLIRFSNVQVGQFRAANLMGFDPTGAPPAGQVINGKTQITTGERDLYLDGTIGADTINGFGLPDIIRGGSGNDLISGGAGNDNIEGQAGSDTVTAGDGNDVVQGGQRDVLRGEAGNDTLTADSGFDVSSQVALDGGDGEDVLRFALSGVQGASGMGGNGRDQFMVVGAAGTIVLDGGADDDLFVMGDGFAGTATITLGVGRDAVTIDDGIEGLLRPVVVTDFAPGPGGDRVALIEKLRELNYGWEPGVNPFSAGLMRLTASGGSTIVQLKAGGVWRDAFILENVAPTRLTGANFDGYSPLGYQAESQTLSGTAGADSIAGGVGADILQGGGGHDTVSASHGDDSVDGGDGDDLIELGRGLDIAFGGTGADTIRDLAGEDETFYGGAGNDALQLLSVGRAGQFLLDGGDGDDSISAQAQFPISVASATIMGGAGNDTISLGPFAHTLVDAGSGNDEVELRVGYIGDVSIRLGAGADLLKLTSVRGTKGVATVLDFNTVEDRLYVGEIFPDDDMFPSALRLAQAGADTLLQFRLFSPANEWMTIARIVGVDANTIQIQFTPASPVVTSGDLPPPPLPLQRIPGLFLGSALADTISGTAGGDTIAGDSGVGYLRGAEGADGLFGGRDFDDINGNQGDDTASGGRGDDWVVGGKDNDSLTGDGGNDLVYGNLGADTCYGGGGNDIIRGGQDNDVVFGGLGDDYVSGDKGDDTMIGDAGADIFHTFGEAGIDRVIDFSQAQGDRVQLDPGAQYTVAQVGADTVITMTGGGVMTLVGVQLSTLTPGWIFGN